jgi:hypothetical protein
MQTVETENQIPDHIDYDESDKQRMSWQPTLKEGLFKTAVVDIARTVSNKTKNLQLRITFAPLNLRDEPQSPTVTYWVDLPIKNPLVSGHKPSPLDKVKKKFKKFVEAFDLTAMPKGPRKENDKYVSVDGQTMTKEMWDVHNDACNTVALTKAREWYNSPESLKGAVCYTFIKRNEQYANIFYIASNPGDKPVITDDFEG